MKAVLISIKPKWCELIASGRKTVEVRKTKPKIDVSFKCYIYCTQANEMLWILNQSERVFHKKIASIITAKDVGGATKANGKVIGEFVCDKIDYWKHNWEKDVMHIGDMSKLSCVPVMDLMEYLDGIYDKNGNDKYLYAWHITDLVIYDKPKELREFKTKCKEYDKDNPYCDDCKYFVDCRGYEYDESDCACNGLKPVTRPPQSWCYVEDLGV